jgi:hypothetical protein
MFYYGLDDFKTNFEKKYFDSIFLVTSNFDLRRGGKSGATPNS